jgi:DNA/RNA endonuclease YhcR with UshA esterase domain
MKTLVLALCAFCLAATPALAQTQAPAAPATPSTAAGPATTQAIAPADAKAHVGQTVTVEGAVSDVNTVRTGVTFIDLGGKFPDNAFTAVILSDDAGKFPNVAALNGKTVVITGKVVLYKGKPQVVLNDAAQITAK